MLPHGHNPVPIFNSEYFLSAQFNPFVCCDALRIAYNRLHIRAPILPIVHPLPAATICSRNK
jgi:hypothetical protein